LDTGCSFQVLAVLHHAAQAGGDQDAGVMAWTCESSGARAAGRVPSRMAVTTDHSPPPRRRLAWLRPIKLEPPINPALMADAERRADQFGNRIADTVTRFAGSMTFVYLHVLWFGCWIGFGVEAYPYGLLTMIVSLEAIFLSTFVMISQNRADAKQQAIADQEWRTVQEEDQQNRQLLELSNQILALTKEVHDYAAERRAMSAGEHARRR
jgi:uncharacterized membrane protein